VLGLPTSVEAASAQSPPTQNSSAPEPGPGGICVSPGPHGFSDVPSGSYYDVAVGWLLEAGITTGVAPGRFGPTQSVTRGQMAVFLWAAAGSPTVEGTHQFTDINTGAYYENAVIWLVGEGITSGVAPGKYAPTKPVTRGQMAVFLWAAAGSPTVEGTHQFTDINAGAYYENAVIWLVGEGITSGVAPGKYAPTKPVTRAQMAVFLHTSACAKAQTFTTPALPAGNDRFVDALTRDLLGREPTDTERSGWVTQLDDGGLTREEFAADLAGGDEFLGLVVDNTYLTVLDRLATGPERTAGITRVGTDGGAEGLLLELLAGAEFFEMAGSTNQGFVYTAGQRVLKRDLTADEAAPHIAGLANSSKSRTEIAGELAGGVEGSKVRAKMWSQKLLSRDPTDPELQQWGGQIETAGDLAVVATIAGGDAYLLIAQDRIVKSSLTTSPGTVVVTGAEVVSAVYGTDGSGTVVLATGVIPPAVGRHLVVSNPTDPAAGGVGKVTVLTPGTGGQTAVQVIAAGLADAFASGEMIDTTELVDPVPEPAEKPGPSNQEKSGCSGAFSWGAVRADIGIDAKNDSSINWGWTNFDARIAAKVTPRMAVTVTGLSVSGSCSKALWNHKLNAPIQAGLVTIPGYFQLSSTFKVSGQATAFEMTGSMKLPCTIGVKATKSSVSNLSGCDKMKSSLTVTPQVEASAHFSGDLEVGYFLGVDEGGWFEANIGLTAGLEAGIDAEARLVQNPGWEVDAYLDANVDIEGNLLGRWKLNHNLATKRLKTWRIADGDIGQGTPDGGTYQPGEDSVNPPPAPSPVTAIAAGGAHSCALKQNGTVACWGRNYEGQLGDGTTTNRPTPAPVTGLSGVTAITTGSTQSCALKQGGTVACWGSNYFGQLGDGTTTDRLSPTAVVGLSGVTAITGGSHSCALKQNGTVACWGWNAYGELGDGTTTDRWTPTPVTGLTGVTAITAGIHHSCALKQDGTVACWGWNGHGELGDGTVTDRSMPTPVVGLTGVTAITASEENSCALKQNGTAACWGSNFYGQLGDGTTTNRVTPTVVVGLAGVTAISSSCALKQDATVACWGPNSSGQIGDGTTTDRLTPTAVVGLTGATVISSSGSTACALAQDDSIACWGYNQDGQLGNGTTTNRSIPTAIVRS
jgi:alpha-tubulin suppressor-like RCC1 family protein